MRPKDWVRPAGNPTIHQLEIDFLKSEIARLDAKSILEFGPGSSTEIFSGLHVTTIEHSDKWLDAAKERFKDNPSVRVLKGEDEIPFLVPEMGDDERFDMAFVDAPQGYLPMRKIHKGYEDCSRFNTTLFALERCPVVFLHDIRRPLERGTLGRLNRMGYHVEPITTPFGMARITHNGGSTRPDLSGATQPGGIATGASP